MSRKKKTRRITDIMPTRKADKPVVMPKVGKSKNRKPTRYELDLLAKEAKKKRKHKGLPSGSRTIDPAEQKKAEEKVIKDSRIGSKKKVPLVVEFINRPEKNEFIKPVPVEEKAHLAPEQELAQLENNECLNQLLDDIEAGKKLSVEDQKFVDDCLDRVHELMEQLGIVDEDESEDDLLRQFETMDVNKFR
ncbi:Der GTPase-activating protein YihI [Bibersteinia trehalosi]|uniref:Der GTPase-activating protein YihI n=1 Tax=Bibersteinia trehalosi TaxID=47735 RepID=UPI003D285814